MKLAIQNGGSRRASHAIRRKRIAGSRVLKSVRKPIGERTLPPDMPTPIATIGNTTSIYVANSPASAILPTDLTRCFMHEVSGILPLSAIGRKRRLLFIRPERSRRVCAGAVIRLRSARTGGGAALRLGVVRTRRILNSSPALAGVQLETVVTAVAPRYSGYPVWAPAFAGGAFRDVGLLGSPHPNPSPEGEGLFV